MKSPLVFLPNPRTLGLWALLLLSPAALTATETKPVPLPPGYAPAKPEDPWQRRVNDVRLEGVPYSEVAAGLAKSFPEINFVVTPGESDELAVSLSLRNVTLDDIFTAMNLATGGRVQAAKINDRMVNFKLVEAAASEPSPKKICRAFSLSRYLSGRSDKETDTALVELEDALKQCWTMLQKANPTDIALQRPELSLHPTTKLLIVVGVPEQLAVVEEVVNQLEGVPAQPMIDPTTGLPVPTTGGYGGGGGGRGGGAGFGSGSGGRGMSTGLDSAAAELFRRRYGIAPPVQPTPPTPPAPAAPPAPSAPSTSRPESSK